MSDILTALAIGWDSPSTAVLFPRLAVGVFFAISGYHKLFNPARHAKLVRTLSADKVPFLRFNQWWVPSVELVAGISLTLGLLSSLSALLLLAICAVASFCEARKKVAGYEPIDTCDVVDDYLYLPEVIYALVLIGILWGGPGQWSLDELLFAPAHSVYIPVTSTLPVTKLT